MQTNFLVLDSTYSLCMDDQHDRQCKRLSISIPKTDHTSLFQQSYLQRPSKLEVTVRFIFLLLNAKSTFLGDQLPYSLQLIMTECCAAVPSTSHFNNAHA